jgi:plastocyanin
MPQPDIENIEQLEDKTTSRRRLLLGLGIGGSAAALGIVKIGFASSALSDDDKDDDDDHDNSGPGSGDDHDDDDHGNSGPGNDDDDHDDDTVVPSEETPAGSTEVRIVEDDPDGFQPGTVTIDAGQTVTFINAHDDPHTATGGSFDTGILQPGDISTITFDEPGTFPYACLIHPEMTGTIDVRGGTGTPESATPEASPATAAEDEVAVSIENLQFIPPEIRVAAGSTVTWTNEDVMAHTATSLDGTFDTGNLAQGQSGTVTFDAPGQFDYLCAIHTGMKGTVIVE